MDHSKFKETENKYMELKSSLEGGSISSEDLKLKLKQMMIKDDDGNYWMIGSNTGKWYIYNGTDWKEKDPYSGANLSKTQNFSNISSETIMVEKDEAADEHEIVLQKKLEGEEDNQIVLESNDDDQISLEKKEEEITFGTHEEEQKTFQADSEIQKEEEPALQEESHSHEPVIHEQAAADEPVARVEDSTVQCIICKSKIDNHSVYCGYCGANQKELSSKKAKPGEEMLIRSFRITSLIFFFGGLGLIAGVIFGATFGIFDIFGDLLAKFPEMLVEYRGKLQGGLIFAALGGIFGFFSFAIFFGLSGLIYNAFSYLFGGVRIRTR